MKPNVLFLNYATPLQSTLTFLRSIQKDNMILVRPDFVLVQFGLVDANYPGSQIPISEYETNLREIVQLIRQFGGTPILVTPPVYRYFDELGKIIPFLEEHSDVTRRLSVELQTYLIDLNKLSTELFNGLGQSASDYISSPGDPAHYTEIGAGVVAGRVVNAFPKILRPQVLE